MLDYAQAAMVAFGKRNPSFPKENILIEDFFEHVGVYDMIIEQTLFCAIDPLLRQAYAEKVAELLDLGGKLVGLMFNREFETGPPFGGDVKEYIRYFDPYFNPISMSECYNSIPERQGNEVFVNLTKSQNTF